MSSQKFICDKCGYTTFRRKYLNAHVRSKTACPGNIETIDYDQVLDDLYDEFETYIQENEEHDDKILLQYIEKMDNITKMKDISDKLEKMKAVKEIKQRARRLLLIQ